VILALMFAGFFWWYIGDRRTFLESQKNSMKPQDSTPAVAPNKPKDSAILPSSSIEPPDDTAVKQSPNLDKSSPKNSNKISKQPSAVSHKLASSPSPISPTRAPSVTSDKPLISSSPPQENEPVLSTSRASNASNSQVKIAKKPPTTPISNKADQDEITSNTNTNTHLTSPPAPLVKKHALNGPSKSDVLKGPEPLVEQTKSPFAVTKPVLITASVGFSGSVSNIPFKSADELSRMNLMFSYKDIHNHKHLLNVRIPLTSLIILEKVKTKLKLEKSLKFRMSLVLIMELLALMGYHQTMAQQRWEGERL
jgi:hypothetical protein